MRREQCSRCLPPSPEPPVSRSEKSTKIANYASIFSRNVVYSPKLQNHPPLPRPDKVQLLKTGLLGSTVLRDGGEWATLAFKKDVVGKADVYKNIPTSPFSIPFTHRISTARCVYAQQPCLGLFWGWRRRCVWPFWEAGIARLPYSCQCLFTRKSCASIHPTHRKQIRHVARGFRDLAK